MNEDNELKSMLRRIHDGLQPSIEEKKPEVTDFPSGKDSSVSALHRKFSFGSIAAVKRVQRAFRRSLYRFDRSALVDRLRLELRLEIVGGRVVICVILLIIVYLNLLATNESSSFAFWLTQAAESLLSVGSFAGSPTWNDIYSSTDEIASVLYTIGSQSYPVTTSTVAIPSYVNSTQSAAYSGSTYAINSWRGAHSKSGFSFTGALQSAPNTICWRLSVSDTELKYTDAISGMSVSGTPFRLDSSSRLLFVVSVSSGIMSVFRNAEQKASLTLPVVSNAAVSPCYSSDSLIGVTSSSEASFYLYTGALSASAITNIYLNRFPFAAESSNPYVFQSIPPLSDQVTDTLGGTRNYVMVCPGIISVDLTALASPCEIDASILSDFYENLYGGYDYGSVSTELWCRRTNVDRPAAYFPVPRRLDVSGALQDYGFVALGTPSNLIKQLPVLFPGELATANPISPMKISFMIKIRDANKLVLYTIEVGTNTISVNTEHTVVARESYWTNMFLATAYAGIVISSFFLLKDVLVFVVNVTVWTRERSNYIKHKLTGVIENRAKQFIWMLTNVVTNSCVLVLLIGRLSIGDIADSIQSDLKVIDYAVGNAAAIPSYTDRTLRINGSITSIGSAFTVFNEWNDFGIVCLYLLLFRVIHSLSGHPRVGILTATWRTAGDDILHLSFNFLVLYFTQAVVGLVVMSEWSPLMTTYGSVCLSQWRALVSGTWMEVDATLDVHGYNWMQILYFAIFLVSIRVCLLNFFIAIQIDAYMAVREHVTNHQTAQSFLRDVIETARTKLLVKFGYLPNRQEVIAMLVEMYATPIVGMEEMRRTWVFSPTERKDGDKRLQRFCNHYWTSFESVRAGRTNYEERSPTSSTSPKRFQDVPNSDWRKVLAEIEVMRKVAGKDHLKNEIKRLKTFIGSGDPSSPKS